MTSDADSEALQTLVDGMNDAVLVVDLDGNYLAVNDTAVERLGYTRSELRERGPEDLTTPAEAEEVTDRIADVDEEETLVFETVQRTNDGEEIPVEINASRITYEGEPAILAVARDITDRKETERQLRQRERRFRTLFENHSAPMLLIEPETGAIQDANAAATDFYGYDEAELTDMRIQEINRLTPEEVARERECAERERRNHFVFEHELADGDVRTVEVHSSPISVEEGELLFSVIHDVTERVEYERELQQYKDLVENVPVGIYRNTPGEAGDFVEVNPAMVEMFDADSAADLLDHDVRDLYADPEDRAAVSDTLCAEGVVREREVNLQRLSGEEFWATVTAVADDTGTETFFDGAIQDVTERREYERRLEEQRDNLEILNEVVRHDIRNDLQLVLAYLELLADNVEDPEVTEYVETALEGAESAIDLTQTARDMADVMLQSDPEREPVPLAHVLEREVDELRSTHTDTIVTVEGTLPHVQVFADDMLDSVLRNLLQNAVQHNDEDVPEVAVAADERPDHVLVRIADNGPGVPDDRKDEIFGKGETGLDSAGSGLGLYLVNTLIEQYDGEVWVEDNDPEGAVFKLRLPKAE
jgi:PAS domain S-box-containing protein